MQQAATQTCPDGLDLRVTVDFAYPVVFADGLFGAGCEELAGFLRGDSSGRRCRFVVFIDDGVADAHPALAGRIAAYAAAHSKVMELAAPALVLPGGETAKNSFEVALKVIRLARQVHLCRQSYIMAVGGGALLDAVGFAASLVHRGIRLIRVPTTVLAQNDSGVGVKNGLNLRGAKNFLGTFAPPAAVFNDSSFLATLSDRDWVSGIAEAFKVGLIKDAGFLAWLHEAGGRLARRDLPSMVRLIRRCAELHMDHIATAGDPFESGSARPLDFGHWAAHKLESLSLNELRHGEAVAIGMAIDLLYAADVGFISHREAEGEICHMARIGLPVWHETLAACDPSGRPLVLNGIEEFRQHLGGCLHVTLPCPLGARTEVEHLDEDVLVGCIDRLGSLAHSSCPRHGIS